MTYYDPNGHDLFQIDPGQYGAELSVEESVQLQAFQTGLAVAESEIEIAPDATERAEQAAVAIPLRAPVVLPPLRLRTVSGSYQSSSGSWNLELRVDVDGTRPLLRVSGDFYRVSGGTVSYFGSFIVNAPRVSTTARTVTITGTGTYTYSTSAPHIRVTVPRVTLVSPPAVATLQFSTSSGSPGATYVCNFRSPYFRTVELEQDSETGVTPFSVYNTGALPSGGPARPLSVAAAYAEAGVAMVSAGISNVVGVAPGGTWSDAELHNAMQQQFSLWRELPQWKVWLFHAMRHDLGPGLLGIMFDQQGRQRQGCAVFYQSIGGNTPARLRNQLYTCVHELGHCFNLFHSFHKSYMQPPLPNRPDALSWMNYPQRYPAGENAFWAAFPFQFDTLETLHLRHGFRDNVIMGGNPFGTGAALEMDHDFDDPVMDHSGLRLELRAARSVDYGEPVVVELKLSTTDLRGKVVHSHLHPSASFVHIAVQKPGGQVTVYEPMLERCMRVETTVLDTQRPAIYDSAYIGYGKDGFVFDQPGVYRLRAAYQALDGSKVLSNPLTLRVRTPLRKADEEVAELLLDDQQGQLLTLLGSDSEYLQSGNAALDTLLDKYGQHPLAVYARLVKGYNAARPFKTILAGGEIKTRSPDVEVAAKSLDAVIEVSEKKQGVDNITLQQVMCRLARTQQVAGDSSAAEQTVQRMLRLFRGRKLRPDILQTIESRGQSALHNDG